MIAWIGHIGLEQGFKFWSKEEKDGFDHFSEITLNQVLTSYIGYRDLPYEEAEVTFK